MTKIIKTPYTKYTEYISPYHHGCKIKNIILMCYLKI